MKKVIIIGHGHIGLPFASEIAQQTFEVEKKTIQEIIAENRSHKITHRHPIGDLIYFDDSKVKPYHQQKQKKNWKQKRRKR